MKSKQGRGSTNKSNQSAKAGVTFPIARIRRYLKRGTYADRVDKKASGYLAAVLEYLAAEILELSGQEAKSMKKSRIAPRHIKLAISNDEELNKLLNHATISSGGIVPRASLNESLKQPDEKKCKA